MLGILYNACIRPIEESIPLALSFQCCIIRVYIFPHILKCHIIAMNIPNVNKIINKEIEILLLINFVKNDGN